MVNTAAKGRRFEYKVQRLLRDSGYVVVRCAASKPFDLVAANHRVVYAIECKSSPMSPTAAKNIYIKLTKIITLKMEVEEWGVTADAPSMLIPLVFYVDTLERISMFTRAIIHTLGGNTWRPFWNDGKLTEIIVKTSEEQ
jgi:Holliday junction resolvase-like predicted endonuclease